MQLQLPPGDTAGYLFGGRVIGHRVYTIDPVRAAFRAFDRSSGALLGQVSAPGDDAGDFRHPIAITVARDHRILVLDDKRRVLSYRDSDGTFLREARLPAGSYQAAIANGDGTVTLAGTFFDRASSATPHDLHDVDSTGHVIRSYGAPTKPQTEWARRFNTEFVAPISGMLVVSAMNSREIRLYDPKADSYKSILVADGWRPITWPADGLLQRGATTKTSAQRISEFSRTTPLITSALPMSSGRLLVKYSAFGPDGSRMFYYAVVDTAGQNLLLSHGTRENVIDVAGDTLFWIQQHGPRLADFGESLIR